MVHVRVCVPLEVHVSFGHLESASQGSGATRNCRSLASVFELPLNIPSVSVVKEFKTTVTLTAG